MVEAATPVDSGMSGGLAGLPGTFVTACRHRISPVCALRQKTSCRRASPPDKNTRSSHVIGEPKPLAGTGTFQAIPVPLLTSHSTGTLVKTATPLPSAPRNRGQFFRSSDGDAASAAAVTGSPTLP